MRKLLKQLKLLLLQLQKLLGKKITIPNLPKPKKIVLHHVGGTGNFAQINAYHMRKWGMRSSLGHYIGYHYFIEVLGRVTQGRADNEEGAHCVDPRKPGYWNKNSIGVCLEGNLEIEEPTTYQLRALAKLLERLKAKYSIESKSIYFHKNIVSTLCPGKKLIAHLKR